MNKIAIIPARSGSKGLPHKNILNLYGKPLIVWSIEAALKSKEFDRVIISTDSKQYGKISMEYGAEVVYRNSNVSDDNASTYDVIIDLFSKIDLSNIDYFVLLQPTSPLRNEYHIRESIELFEKNYNNYDTLVSVTEAHKSSDLLRPIDETLSLKYFNKDFSNYKRQKYKEYEPNGAIFISKINTYLKIKHFFGMQGIAYIMDRDNSIDIDGRNDFELAINLLTRKNKENETENLVKTRIQERKNLKNNINNPITLIGHSFFDKWDIKTICNKGVNNWGINGCTAQLCKKFILDKCSFELLDKIVIVMFGTNEIIFESNISKIIEEINDCIKKIYFLGAKKVYFINITNVNGCIDRDNYFINSCKSEFSKYIKANKIILTDRLNDEFGWLNKDYTYDGLHLNDKGYDILSDIIEEEIYNEL